MRHSSLSRCFCIQIHFRSTVEGSVNVSLEPANRSTKKSARIVLDVKRIQSHDNDWTWQDEEFFNFIRHYNTSVWLATQVYDGVDLNCRRAVEYTYFFQRLVSFPLFTRNISRVEINRSIQCKTEDKNYHIVSRGFSKNALLTNWNIGEIPIATGYFYRRSYYKLFNSYYTDNSKVIRDPLLWDNIAENEGANKGNE